MYRQKKVLLILLISLIFSCKEKKKINIENEDLLSYEEWRSLGATYCYNYWNPESNKVFVISHYDSKTGKIDCVETERIKKWTY